MLKVGLIGCGGVGSIHAKCWTALGDCVQLTAIADADVDKAFKCAEPLDARVYKDGYEMLMQEAFSESVQDLCG